MTFYASIKKFSIGKASLGFVAAIAMTAAVAATGADASTVRDCTVSSVKTDGTPMVNALACSGVFNKNGQPDDGEIAAALDAASASLFVAPLTWTDLGKIDGPGTNSEFSITNLLGSAGNWTITNPVVGAVYAFLMKGANDYAVYIPSTPGWTGTWSTDPDIRTGGSTGDKNVAGLSNFSVYRATAGTPPPPPPPPNGVIPLPAAGWLLLTGLGGLAMMRRRKSA